jgi:putative nucleotidyltransferase with HDIG domain
MPRFRSHLALKIVLPYAVLTLAIGAIGTVAATSQLSSRSQEAFDNQLIEDGFVTQSVLQSYDAERRAMLRLLLTAPVSQVFSRPDLLQQRLERALAIDPNAQLEATDLNGRELVGVQGHGQNQETVSHRQDLSVWPGLQYMLSGGAETADLLQPGDHPALFSAEVVRDSTGLAIGAVLVGESLDNLVTNVAAAVHDDISLYDQLGHLRATTLNLSPDRWSQLQLDQSTRNGVSPSTAVQVQRNVSGPATELLGPWSTGTSNLGYVGVVSSSAGLVATTNGLRLIMVLLFLAGVVLTLLIGLWLARLITRPVHTLVEATRLVSAGDLEHRAPVTTRDEIGELTESFNQMTRSLKEKSASLKQTMSQLQDTYLMTIEALAAAVEARDPYTHGHTQRVGDYAVLMAKVMGCDETEIAAIKRASVLHDIGKIGIEDQILRKQGRLETEEELRMQRHPVIGVEMLKGIDFLDPVLPIIRHHHERWDGNGYPDQLKADEIPLGARILAVADALDAMTSDRPYRAARTFEYAKAEILKGSATHFDPEVVTAFIKSQREIENMLMESSQSEVHHPEPGDLGAWRLHVVGR